MLNTLYAYKYNSKTHNHLNIYTSAKTLKCTYNKYIVYIYIYIYIIYIYIYIYIYMLNVYIYEKFKRVMSN